MLRKLLWSISPLYLVWRILKSSGLVVWEGLSHLRGTGFIDVMSLSQLLFYFIQLFILEYYIRNNTRNNIIPPKCAPYCKTEWISCALFCWFYPKITAITRISWILHIIKKKQALSKPVTRRYSIQNLLYIFFIIVTFVSFFPKKIYTKAQSTAITQINQ